MAGARSVVLGRRGPPDVAVAFTSDGHLLSSSDGGVLRRWPLAPASGEDARVLWSQPDTWIGAFEGRNLEVDRQGRFVVMSEIQRGTILVVPLDGSPTSSYQSLPGGASGWTYSPISIPAGGS